MPKLTIPPRYRGTLAKIHSTDKATMDALVAALESTPPSSRRSEVVGAICSRVTGLDRVDVESIVDMVYELYQVQVQQAVSLPSLIDELVRALGSDVSPELRLSEAELAELRTRMTSLLGMEALRIFAKAFRLQREYQNLFCEARILTDMRPVFGEDAAEQPVQVFLAHTLRITYHTGMGRETHEVFFALDADDLKKLKAVIERAESKAANLYELLETKAIPNLVL